MKETIVARFKALKLWQKALVILLLLSVVIGPFQEKKTTIQKAEPTVSMQVGTGKILSESDKKRIYAEYIYAQRKAGEETSKLYPVKEQMKKMQEYLKYDEENRVRHYRGVAERNALSYDELIAIVDEANAKMWEMPAR